MKKGSYQAIDTGGILLKTHRSLHRQTRCRTPANSMLTLWLGTMPLPASVILLIPCRDEPRHPMCRCMLLLLPKPQPTARPRWRPVRRAKAQASRCIVTPCGRWRLRAERRLASLVGWRRSGATSFWWRPVRRGTLHEVAVICGDHRLLQRACRYEVRKQRCEHDRSALPMGQSHVCQPCTSSLRSAPRAHK